MAHDFVHVGCHSINSAHVCHVTCDGVGGVKLAMTSGECMTFTGEEADAVAKAFGRHDSKHLTAAEAKAEAKAEKAAEVKAEEKAEPKAHGHHK